MNATRPPRFWRRGGLDAIAIESNSTDHLPL
jgi:hypothetical protein